MEPGLTILFVLVALLMLASVILSTWLGLRDDRRKAERHVTEQEIKHKQLELMDQATSFKIGSREYTVHREAQS